MHRFFVNPSNINGGTGFIDGEDVSHIARVLRLRPDDEICVCDGQKNEYNCIISKIDKNIVEFNVAGSLKCETEPDINVTLFQGLPKSDKMDYIVQKCVELGVNAIVPVMTKRTVTKISDSDKKIKRWQKIASEAAKQCKRGIIPKVSDVHSFDEAIKSLSSFDLSLMPYEEQIGNPIKDILTQNKESKNIAVFIGPEGGFDEEEVRKAKNLNIFTLTLGKRILRTETAPVAVLSVIMYEFGQLQ